MPGLGLGLGLGLTNPRTMGVGAPPSGFAFVTFNGAYVTRNGAYVIQRVS